MKNLIWLIGVIFIVLLISTVYSGVKREGMTETQTNALNDIIDKYSKAVKHNDTEYNATSAIKDIKALNIQDSSITAILNKTTDDTAKINSIIAIKSVTVSSPFAT
jgi:DNA-binding transcriptional regulator YhcF (GntR family)